MHDYPDVFKGYYSEGDLGLQLVFPSRKDVHEMFMKKLDQRALSLENN